MPSFKSITLAIAAAFVATSSAQKFYDIEPQSVDKGLRSESTDHFNVDEATRLTVNLK